MHKSTAVRILYLLPLLPAGLAEIVCYDIASPMHPEILTPVENCWCLSSGSTGPSQGYSAASHSKDKGGHAPAPAHGSPGDKPGNGPSPAKSPGNGKGSDKDDRGDGKNNNNGNANSPASIPSSTQPAAASATTTKGTQVNLPFFSFAPASPLKSILGAPALPPPDWNSPNQVYFNIACKENQSVCDGMSQTLNAAGWYISQVTPISMSN